MSRRAVIAKGILAIGLMLLGYTVATGSSITGKVTFNYTSPALKVQFVMLMISLALIMASCVLFLLKKGPEEEYRRISQQLPQYDERLLTIKQEEIADKHQEL